MASEEYKRGQHIISADEAFERADRLLPLDDFGLTWGGVVLPSKEADTHFCVVGATGSGKTTILRLLMQSALPLIGAEYKEKSYEVEQPKEKIPTPEEVADYEVARAQYNAAFAMNQATLKKNVQEIEDRLKENEAIRQKNAAAEQEKKEIAQELSTLSQVKHPLFWLITCASITTCLVLVTDEIVLLICLALSVFLWVKVGQRAKRRNALKAQIEALKAKNDALILLDEKAAIAPVVLPPLPACPPTEPQPQTVMTRDKVAPMHYFGDGHRAMIYDAKGDTLSLLYGMGLKCPIEILNPFDARAVAWDIAKDVTTPATARQFATILIPEDKNASQPFFANSARDLVAQAMLALIQLKPEEWSLRDLLLTLQSTETLTSILSKTSQGKIKVKTYFDDDKTGNNILSEIATRMSPFESVTEAWSHCPRKISLSEWVESEGILVLGTSEENRAALDPINRVLFQRATELTLSQSESSTRRTWFYMDEVRDAGNLESLGRLMTKGRSKGASVVLGFQDIDGMHDAFGKERANEFIGQCANKAILRLNSPETAEWASKLFGKYEFMEEESGENKGGSKTTGKTTTEGTTKGKTKTTGSSDGTTTGKSWGSSETFGTSSGRTNSFSINGGGGNSTQTGSQDSEQTSEQKSEQTSKQTSKSLAKQNSTQSSTADNKSDTESWTTTINKKRMEKDALLASEFMMLPVTNPRNGMHGYYFLPCIGAFYGVLDSAYIKGSLLPPDNRQPNYLPRPVSQQYLQEWNAHERALLGLTETRPVPSSTAAVTVPAEVSTPAVTAEALPITHAEAAAPAATQRADTGPVRQADPDKTARVQAFLNRSIR